MRPFLLAVQLLTRVPVRLDEAPGREEQARAAAWFPLVGGAVGLCAYAAFWLADRARLPALAPWAALAAAVALTGAFHEDGLADAADGLFGGSTPERRLAIMRDSRLGSYGVLALLLVVGVQIGALGGVPRALVPGVLVAAHALARAAALPLMRLPYARREGGLGASVAGRVPPASLAIGVALGAASLALLPWPLALAAALAAALVAGVAAYRFWRDLGGITGDALGAVVKLVEVATYVVAAAFAAWRP